jgi:NADH-quinone oxidoreductase subunit I
MEAPPHEMQLGATERDYYLGLTSAPASPGGGGERQ